MPMALKTQSQEFRNTFGNKVWSFSNSKLFNHWLVVATAAECADDVLYLYDSLSSGYSSKNVVKQICEINFCQIKQLRFCKRSTQQQSNGVDCGAFAICNEFAIQFFTGKKKLWRIKIKKPSANVFGTSQTCSIPAVN